jgi:pimeloyl-ACP methyl ester carboxylesterase
MFFTISGWCRPRTAGFGNSFLMRPLCGPSSKKIGAWQVATFYVAHGAWSAGWAWKKMHPVLAQRGHALITPTHTGLGERSHLARPDIDLETHIADHLGVLRFDDLRDLIVIGHSYGGMVATGLADRAPDRIKTLVYLDAFAPRDGDSVFSLNPEREAPMREAAAKMGGFMPPAAMPPDTSEADKAWAAPRRMPQPLQTFAQGLKLSREPVQPRHYIYCKRHNPGDPFRQFLERARREGWPSYEIDASHNPHITCPEILAEVLERIVCG